MDPYGPYDRHPNSEPISYKDENEDVSIGKWLLILILTAIPIVNIITVTFLAFGVENHTLRNYGKAVLILMVIGFFFGILFAF